MFSDANIACCALQVSVLVRNKEKVFFYYVDYYLVQLLSTRYWCGRSGVQFPGRLNWHSVADSSPLLRRFFGAVLPRR